MVDYFQSSEFIKTFNRESNMYRKFGEIIDRSDKHGYLHKIQTTLNEIFKDELNSLSSGQLTRILKIPSNQKPSLTRELPKNRRPHFQGEPEVDIDVLWSVNKWIKSTIPI